MLVKTRMGQRVRVGTRFWIFGLETGEVPGWEPVFIYGYIPREP
jgi:hypothetical protein